MKTGGKKAYQKRNAGRLYKKIMAVLLIAVLCSIGIMTVFAEEEDMMMEPSEVQEDIEEYSVAEPEMLALDSPESDITPEHHKYIKYNGGDSYTLNLDVKGLYDSSSEKRKVDVILIIDRSGSMSNRMNNNESRLDVIKKIVNEKNGMAESILANEDIDGRMAVVTYSGQAGKGDQSWDDAWVTVQWTGSQEEVTTNVNEIVTDGGTNCQAGLRTAKDVLKSAREDAEKFVIFLSDGEPTFCYNKRGKTSGTGRDDQEGTNAEAAYKEAETISGLTGFYCVGIISEDNGNQNNFLTTLNSKPQSKNRGTYFNNNAEELIQTFQEITALITEYTCRGIIIKDTLSDYADISSAQLDGYQIVVTDENGNSVEQLTYNGNTVTPKDLVAVTYDSASKTVNAVFPEDYVLDKNYTYTVQFLIQPSQFAYDTFLVEKYLHKGSEGSDAPNNETSSGKEGFFTNTEASLQYIYGEENAEVNNIVYKEQPVLQVQTGSLMINKEVSGAMGDKTKLFDIQIELYKNDGTPFSGSLSVLGETINGFENVGTPVIDELVFENGKAEVSLSHGQQIRINNLPFGIKYIVTENTPQDYEATYNGEAVKNVESKIMGEAVAEIVNSKEYVPPTGIKTDRTSMRNAYALFTIGLIGFAGFVAKYKHKKRKIY